MLRKPNNWNEVQEYSESAKLPLGAYVCKIKKVGVQSTDYGKQLCLVFDIAEGEHKGFYNADFVANQNADKRWKGVLRLFIPKDDGSESDEWTKRTLKSMITAVEKSNPGYVWNWDEASLTGKMIGVLFRNEEWEYEGRTGWTVRPFRALSIDTVRSGNFKLPNDRPLKNKTTNNFTAAAYPRATEAERNEVYGYVNNNFDDDDVPF